MLQEEQILIPRVDARASCSASGPHGRLAPSALALIALALRGEAAVRAMPAGPETGKAVDPKNATLLE